MQIKLVIKNIEKDDLKDFSKESSVICLKSISSWMIDYYFTNIYLNQIKNTNKSRQPNNIIGFYDMFNIYQRIQSSPSAREFLDLCKNKLKQIKNDVIVEKYNNYLNHCGLIDIIDLFHQCRLDSFINTMILSIYNIKSQIDRLFFEYLLELPSSTCCIYDVKTKLITTETRENLLKLIYHEKIIHTPTNTKNSIKHTLCTYLSFLLDTRNEHALIHCLMTCSRADIPELQRLIKCSKNESLTIYQILLSFLRRKELILNGISLSSEPGIINVDDELFDKYYIDIKEFIQFIEQLQMIIEENEDFKIESITIFRKLLESISKQISFNQCESVIKEIIEEFCQDFQTTLPLMNYSLPIQSASSGRRFLRSVAYLCAKQTIDLPVIMASTLTPSSILIDQKPVEEKTVNLSMESVCDWQMKSKESCSNENQRCLDLSTIHETSFESDSIIDPPTTCENKVPSPSIVKRQPLREIDINTFNNEDRLIENEKIYHQNPIVFTLVSDGDKENLPVTMKKRSIISTNIEPPCKKQKKTNIKSSEIEQKLLPNLFQSTN